MSLVTKLLQQAAASNPQTYLERLRRDVRNPPATWQPRTATRPTFDEWRAALPAGFRPRGDNTLEYEYAVTYFRLPTNQGDFFTRYGVAIASLGVGAAVASAAGVASGFASAAPPVEISPIYGATEGGTMSILGDIFSTVSQGVDLFRQVQSVRSQPATLAPIAMGAMPQVARALPAIGAAGAMVVRGAGAVMRSANTYCRRNPAWCAQIGGTAAIASMIQSGQLPTVRRRRRRGISGRDLGAYRRVHNLLAGFCSPKAKIRKTC